MISVRTFINTTFFRIFAFVIFRGYTQWIDNTPAQEFLHFVQRDDMGNLTVTKSETLSVDSESKLVKKLDDIERMIQVTNMTCSENLFSSHNTTSSSQQNINLSEQDIAEPYQNTEKDNNTITIPVFNVLTSDEQFGPESLSQRSYTLSTDSPDVKKIFQLIKNPPLSLKDKENGLQAFFSKSDISLQNASLHDGVLELELSGGDDLSEQEYKLFLTMLKDTYSQFSGVTSITIT